MIKPEILDAMVAAGCTAQQIVAAVKADQASASGAERQARYRIKKAAESSRVTESDACDVTSRNDLPPKEKPPRPPKEITPIPVSEARASSTEPRAFDQFWSNYPNRVGKRDAESAFLKALRRADLEIILAGLRRYVAKTDDRPWCNPATWLNQDRWDDAPSIPVQRLATAPPSREPRNAGERALVRIQAERDENERAESLSGRLGQSDGRRQIEGSGIARQFAR